MVAHRSDICCRPAGGSIPSNSGSLDPVIMEAGHRVVIRISALFAPWRALASPTV